MERITKVKTHKGVRIYKSQELLINLHEFKNGKIVERKPIKGVVLFGYGNDLLFNTKQDVIEAIDSIWKTVGWKKEDEKRFSNIMNEGERN